MFWILIILDSALSVVKSAHLFWIHQATHHWLRSRRGALSNRSTAASAPQPSPTCYAPASAVATALKEQPLNPAKSNC